MNLYDKIMGSSTVVARSPQPDQGNPLDSIMRGTFASASTGAGATLTASQLFSDIQAALDLVENVERQDEQRCENAFRELGADLAAGDRVILPIGTPMPDLPAKYRTSVMIARNDLLGNRVVVMPASEQKTYRLCDSPLSL